MILRDPKEPDTDGKRRRTQQRRGCDDAELRGKAEGEHIDRH